MNPDEGVATPRLEGDCGVSEGTQRRVKRKTVWSSSMRSVGYDESDQILEIEFVSGGIYRYFGVPREVYQRMLDAPSKGAYFLEHIKDEYQYSRAA